MNQKTFARILPWLIIIAIIAIVGGRIYYLMDMANQAADGVAGVDRRYIRFNAGFFTRAFTESLKLGSLYALIALGYTLVYGIIRLINFAHGEVFMVGAFITYFLFTNTPYPWFFAVVVAVAIAYGVMRLLELWRGKMNDPVVLVGGAITALIFAIVLSTQTLNLIWALVLSMLLTGVIGISIDRIAYSPLRNAPRNSMLINAIAVSFFLQNAGLLVFTNRQTPFRPETVVNDTLAFQALEPSVLIVYIPLIAMALVITIMLTAYRTLWGKVLIGVLAAGLVTSVGWLMYSLGTVNIFAGVQEISQGLLEARDRSAVRSTWLVFTIPMVTTILVAVLTFFVNSTRLGKAMRATAQDAETAQMMGISVNKVIATTFLLGSMLAAAGGAMWGLNFGSLNQPAVLGILPGIKAFAAAVIGGIGSMPGAVIGALIIGFAENFLTAVFPNTPNFAGITEYKDTFAFVLLIIILLVRPSGIVGEDLSEKV